jgi:hypothetical protein
MKRYPGMHRAVNVATLAVATGISLVVISGTARSAEPPALSAVRQIDSGTPKDIQLALAEAAGPPVSAGATIYLLGPKGYEKAREGTNGFTCLVERPERTDTVAPTCYDVEGSATTLKASLYVEQERAAGKDQASIASAVAEGYKNGRFIAPRKAGIAYMLSDHNYLPATDTKQIIHFPGHLMFYAPYATAKDVGEGSGAPFLTAPGSPANLMVVIPAGTHFHHP